MDVETKLKRFSEVVIKEAEEARQNALSSLEEKHTSNIREFRRKAENKYKEMIAEAALNAEKQKQKRIAQKNAEIKKALIQKRTEYINSIFGNVMDKLNGFFSTPEYEELIVGFIESYKSGSSGEITAYIMSRDAALKDSIQKKTGTAVLLTEEDFLGGVKILLNKNRIADCTLKHKYDQEKAAFNKIKII